MRPVRDVSKPMALLNLLLDLVALVLFLSGLGVGTRMPAHRAGTLLSNLKLAESTRGRRWPLFVALVALLLLRPWFYSTVAEVSGWVPAWDPVPATVPFRPDFPTRLLAFSLVSFAWTLLQFLAWILFAAALARATREPSAWNRFFHEMLGPLSRIPAVLMILLPPIAGALFWMAIAPVFQSLEILPPIRSWEHLALQAGLVGLGVWVTGGWMLCGLLLLRLINTYVYLGTHPFWDFIHQVGGAVLRPVEWIPARIGKLDLTALVVAAIVAVAARAAEQGLTHLYLNLRP
ncbi:MAG: YggT family protein [Verrucomicrobiae bacterium]|nr:YggT family protein [Verrucomicrobiae bacterium]